MDKAKREELQTFFASEAYEVINTTRQKLTAAQENPDLYLQELEWVARRMHTFRQDSNLMGYFDLGNMAYQLEGEARKLMENRSAPDAEDIDRFGIYLENLQLFLDFYNQKSEEADSIYKVRKGFQVSDEVIDLYLVEVQDHVELYHRTLIALDTGKIDSTSAIEEIYRAVHSVKGDSNALGFFKIADLAHKLESRIQVFLDDPSKTVDEAEIDHLFQWGEDLKAIVSQETAARQEGTDNVADTVSEETLPEEPAPDDEITTLYAQEAQDILKDVAHYFKLISAEQDVKNQLESTYRSLHTLKGNSNALGFARVGEVAGVMEDALADLRKNPDAFDTKVFETLLGQFEAVRAAVAALTGDTADLAPLDLTPPEVEAEEPDEITLLYLGEAQDILEDVSPQIAALAPEQDRDAEAVQETVEAVYRGIHTLKGNSNALGFEDIGDVAHELESTLSMLRKEKAGVTAAQFSTVLEQFDALQTAVRHLLGSGTQSPVDTVSEETTSVDPTETANVAEITETAASVESVEPAESVEPVAEIELDELSQLYKQEAEEIIATVESDLLKLESGENLAELLANIYRGMHTLKGNSNALGFDHVGELAHASESLLTRLKNEPELLSPELIQQLFDDVTGIKAALPGNEALAAAIPVTSTVSDYEQFAEDMPELDEIALLYREEAQDIMQTVQAQLLKLESGEMDAKTALESIYRGLHTLKGNSNALGFQHIGQMAHETESLLSELRKTPEKLTPEVLEHIFDDFNRIESALPGNAPETPVVTEDDHEGLDEITVLYLEEAEEIVARFSTELLQLETGEVDLKPGLESIYRALHTLKGNSNALGFAAVGQLAHEAESQLQHLKGESRMPTSDEFERLFKYHKTMVDQLKEVAAGAKAEAEAARVRQTHHEKKSITQELRITQSGLKQAPPIGRTTGTDPLRDSGVKWRKNDLLTTGSGKKKLERVSQEKRKKRAQQMDETIRVSVSKIDQLINLSDELLIHKISYEQKLSHLAEVQLLMRDFRGRVRGDAPDAERYTQHDILDAIQQINEHLGSFEKELKEDINQFALTVDEMQYQSRKTRMLPASVLVDPLRLVVRSTSQKLGKKVDFIVLGDDTELDRFLVEKLKDPLGHLIRNAIDHGLETPAEREKAGKSERAQILVQISLSGNQIVFQIQDDGRGINYEKIRQKAVKVGMFSAEQAKNLSDSELNRLLFSSGFSTADQVTDISGRGVGLDVVRANIESLNGQIEVFTEQNEGTQFRISLPVTLSTFDTFLIRINNQRYAVPSSLILATRLLEESHLILHEGQYLMQWENQPVPVVPMHEFLQQEYVPGKSQESRVLLLNLNQRYLGLIVDDIIEARALVMKQMGSQLQNIKNVAGATILGDGEPIVVLDLQDMYYGFYQEETSFTALTVENLETEVDPESTTDSQIHVLVVDDSVTTRTLEKNILEAAGFKVTIATNGQEAKDKVPTVQPDIIITDCEMPIMDGYGFTSWVKKESPYSHIPMIMVTSLAAEEFKQKAFAAGVNDFIIKGQFKQDIFLTKIHGLLNKQKVTP